MRAKWFPVKNRHAYKDNKRVYACIYEVSWSYDQHKPWISSATDKCYATLSEAKRATEQVVKEIISLQ